MMNKEEDEGEEEDEDEEEDQVKKEEEEDHFEEVLNESRKESISYENFLRCELESSQDINDLA